MFPFSSPQRILDQEREWREAQDRPTPLEDEIKRERNSAWTEEDYRKRKEQHAARKQPCAHCTADLATETHRRWCPTIAELGGEEGDLPAHL